MRGFRCITSALDRPGSTRFPRSSDRVVPNASDEWKNSREYWLTYTANSSPPDRHNSREKMTPETYLAVGSEVQLFEQAFQRRIPVMLTGPTGCGKTRFVEHMGVLLQRPVVTISCHDDLTSSDLVGRFMVTGGDVVWTDGPLTRAVKAGAICYLDEVVEARHDSLAILHSLTDHRRALYLDRAGEVVRAPEQFMLVCSYNPAYRSSLKELKPSFRQRFVTIQMRYLPPDREAELVVAETGVVLATAQRLVQCAVAIRTADDAFHFEPPSTRVLVTAAQLIAAGATEMDAAEACILAPLSTDGAITDGLREVAAASLAAANTPGRPI
jgi:nitric oxide reductase NorQ protein